MKRGRHADAAHAIATMVRDFPVEERTTILQLLDLTVGELNVTAHLRALVSAADLLAATDGLTRVAILALVLRQFGVTEASFSCAECGAKFTATTCHAGCEIKRLSADDDPPAASGGAS